jgi:L-threonate 2-dehydrogenase
MGNAERQELNGAALIGLGQMGNPIAQRLTAAGYRVWGFDPNQQAREAISAVGYTACASAAAAAGQAEVVLVIPFDYSQVEQALFGPAGVLEALQSPGLVVVLSTIGPDNAKSLASRLAEQGHRLVDAPVSGGPAGIEAGTLTIMIGADSADLERCRPLLQTFAGNIFQVGDTAGAGQAAKLANQLLVFTHLVATVEALALGSRGGVDPEQLYQIISRSAGNSFIFGTRARAIIDRSFKTGGSVNILIKDSRLVLEAGRGLGTPTFLAATASQIVELARQLGLGGEDDAAVAKVYERLLGSELT